MVARSVQITSSAKQLASFMVSGESAWLVNTDLANTFYVGEDPGNLTIPIQPLGSYEITAGANLFASTLAAGVTISALITTGQWIPSAAQVAIATANLAKDSSVQAVATSTAAVATNTGAGGTLAKDASLTTANHYLGGTSTGALISGAGRTIAQEAAALLASGNAGGAAGGVPLLRFTGNLGSGNAVAVPGGGAPTLLNTTAVNQPGYEGVFTVQMPLNSGTIPFLKVLIVWTDQTTGLTVGQRTFFLACGNATPLSYYIHGPVKGNQVSISVLNLDPSVTVTLTWGFNITSHVYLADNIIQTAYGNAPNGYTNPAGSPNAGVLSNSNVSIPASSLTTRLIAVYSGRAILTANNTGVSGGDINVFLIDPVASGSGLYGNANSRLQGPGKVIAGNTAAVEVALPYGPLLLQLTNLSTTIATGGNFSMVTEDY